MPLADGAVSSDGTDGKRFYSNRFAANAAASVGTCDSDGISTRRADCDTIGSSAGAPQISVSSRERSTKFG